MKIVQRFVICVAMFVALAAQAQAGLVTLSDQQSQTSTGQDFVFTFNGVPTPSDGTGGTLKIGARGDFSPGASTQETFAYSAEGVVSGTQIRWDLTPNTVLINSFDFDENEFLLTVTLTGAELDALIADGTVSVNVDFGVGTNLFTANSYASVELTYNTPDSSAVPEPSTLALAGLGVIGLVARARRRRKS